MKFIKIKPEKLRTAFYHILSTCVLLFACLTLIILQTIFAYCVPKSSDIAWPSVLIPFGYIPAALLVLTAASTLFAGLTDSEICSTMSVVSCVFPLIMTTAVACTTLQQYVDRSLYKTSMLIMGIVNIIIAVLCLTHSILLCIDIRDCLPKINVEKPEENEVNNKTKLNVNDALHTEITTHEGDVSQCY
ncbi:unnamed protein product [Trichobilharzia regenti]|nr:unnamed protein product [Trichobilharzia regenti]